MDLPEATGSRTRRTASRQPPLAVTASNKKNGAYEFNKTVAPHARLEDGNCIKISGSIYL
jgi:hypothetical protein